MESYIKEIEHLKIPLEEILLATNNFSDTNVIGRGGFGRVYKGVLSHFKGRSMVAIKRLDRKLGQGDTEFWNEITIFSRFTHENLISLLGFCIEGEESFLVYEYASNGSLDRHLSSADLTWTQRLNICLDAARGLGYLHDYNGTKNRILHRDIKSSNILLDADWNAKVSDFGLSKIVPVNQQHSYLITNVVGTPGYYDPEYVKTGFLTKESDVYSLGVVLVEVLCGKLCFEYKNKMSVPMWKNSYEQDKLQEIIFDDLKRQMDQNSLKTFSDIAFRCLQKSRGNRPTMARVVKELETALAYQELKELKPMKDLKRDLLMSAYPLKYSSDSKSTMDYKKMLVAAIDSLDDRSESESTKDYKKMHVSAIDSLDNRSESELIKDYKKMLVSAIDSLDNRSESKSTRDYKKRLLAAASPLDFISCAQSFLEGTLLNSGKTWFSLNMDGQHCELISIAGCLTSTSSESPHYIHSPEYKSRFAVGCYEPSGTMFKTHVRTQFLSPEITYTVNLVFKIKKNKKQYIVIEHKLKGEKETSFSFLSGEREDGWLTAELYQFTSDHKTVDLEIWFHTECCPHLLVEGIEFRPLEQVKHEVLIYDAIDMQLILLDDEIDVQLIPLPDDYEDIIKRAKNSVQWETKRDAYSILCKGFLMCYGEEWFYLTKSGKKCVMVPARTAFEEDRWVWMSRPGTRFKEVAVADPNSDRIFIFCKFNSKMLSPRTTYATYLVYDLLDNYKRVHQSPPVQVVDKDSESKEVYYIFLQTPQTPVISWNEKDEKTFNPISRSKIKGLPRLRSDDWMEVQVHEFQTHDNIKMISTRLKLSSYNMSLEGVVVQGLEFRPISYDPLSQITESKLHNGILSNKGMTWFSRNMNGYNCEMISIAECLTSIASESHCFISEPEYTSRFEVGCYKASGYGFETHVKTQFLSPEITYTVNLVFKSKYLNKQYIDLEYHLVGEQGRSSSYVWLADERDDGWLTAELFQFTSHHKTVNLEIMFTDWYTDLLVESIEFRPVEKVEHEALTVENADMQLEPGTETYWEQKLLIDYEEMIRRSVNGVRWRTKKELYHILCEGFLVNGGKEWFSIAKDGKKCLMLPAKAVLREEEWEWNSNSKPNTSTWFHRFGQVADCVSKDFHIICNISFKMLSPQTTYAAYLVYNGQPHETKDINPPLQVVDRYSDSKEEYYIFLNTPKTPVISWNKKEEKTFNPSSRPKIKGLPRLRSDGWMEVQVHEFQTRAAITSIDIDLLVFNCDICQSLKGITVQGLELRPV